MDPNSPEQPTPTSAPLVCSYCHQPIQPTFYYCPNCGTKLTVAPLSTTPLTQTWIYAFSIVLPFICFLAIGKWPGLKYYRSEDPKTKSIGMTAWILMLLSTVVMCWLAYVWTMDAIQSTMNSINTDLSA
jgi:hypothetical protein